MEAQVAFYKQKLQYETDSWDLAEALKSTNDIVVIDARAVSAWEKEHIPGSTNLPHREINNQSTENLDRSKLYITYCDGIGCNASTKAAFQLSRLGFRVKELIGGLDWWKRDGYETQGTLAQSRELTNCGC
ncbi:rhodanese-like domain-containing protein [Mangrovibacterium lignilyticum]|uniref:rhodanese-like domain-containing protein n=1 Tax=Mangrovibacterium lignilyticum TaxID=2668052 RepID=UPI0013D6308A|nr:rhodanese-like domain-containing protein [Mangrovibacterium lignilyticum]